MSSSIIPRRRNRVRISRSSTETGSSKRQRSAYKYTHIRSQTRRGKQTWKEVTAPSIYEDSDSETELRSPLKSNSLNLPDPVERPGFEYDQEVHGDFLSGGINPIKRKTKVSCMELWITWMKNEMSD